MKLGRTEARARLNVNLRQGSDGPLSYLYLIVYKLQPVGSGFHNISTSWEQVRMAMVFGEQCLSAIRCRGHQSICKSSIPSMNARTFKSCSVSTGSMEAFFAMQTSFMTFSASSTSASSA